MSPQDAALHGTMIPIIGHIDLDDSQIEESTIRASGSGGRRINKTHDRGTASPNPARLAGT
jgi:protein subunit release factor B